MSSAMRRKNFLHGGTYRHYPQDNFSAPEVKITGLMLEQRSAAEDRCVGISHVENKDM